MKKFVVTSIKYIWLMTLTAAGMNFGFKMVDFLFDDFDIIERIKKRFTKNYTEIEVEGKEKLII